MKTFFGALKDGSEASLYTISSGNLTAVISDYGATLVKLFVPDAKGNLSDVVLGFDDPNQYTASGTFFGATVGRNANRVKNAQFTMNGRVYAMNPNDNGCHNLHSGTDFFKNRLWTVAEAEIDRIRLSLFSPDGDQGFPGNATISVTYSLEQGSFLRIRYDGICDKDTVFNMTNHTYFNLAGHEKTEKAMEQILTMPARFYTVSDSQFIPTGELRLVENTPMDFRAPKAIGRDIDAPYTSLQLQGGYDHNFEVFTDPCAILTDPESGRTMAVSTSCPGVQLYTGNFIENEMGKDGVLYPRRSGICLETQHFPDSINHPEWAQPFVKAGTPYYSETIYRFG